MSATVSLNDVFNGAYTARIQDALGNSGANISLMRGTTTSLQINGTPTGSGLKGQQATQGSTVKLSKDTVSISPEARAKLDEQMIALRLLNTGKVSLSASGRAAVPAASAQVGQDASTKPSGKSTPTSSSTIGEGDPEKIIRDTVTAAQAAISQVSTTSGFYQFTQNSPGVLQGFLASFSSSDAAAISTAYNNHTLVVQSPANQVGWTSGNETLAISGTTDSVIGGGLTGFVSSAPDSNTEYRNLDLGFGQLVVSWPKNN